MVNALAIFFPGWNAFHRRLSHPAATVSHSAVFRPAGRALQVILLADGQTIHNKFFDRVRRLPPGRFTKHDATHEGRLDR